MKIVFLGCTTFSQRILEAIRHLGNAEIVGIFSIPRLFKISYSADPVENRNFADLSSHATQLGVPYIEIDSVEGQRISDHFVLMKQLQPDVLLVMGWYYMIPKKIREVPRYGAWGIHASLLPKYAGGAPLVWAMIQGETETGVSLFRFDSGVDDGDIIDQRKIIIEEKDTIREVYEKATDASIQIITKVLSNIDNVIFKPQNKEDIEVWPQRSPADGRIDWSWDAKRLKDFIRAQTHPYPGAWTEINGKKVIIWDADIIDKEL